MEKVINQGIDSHLEGFTKSKFEIKNNRLYCEFDDSEIHILTCRLNEIQTEDAELLSQDIAEITGKNSEEK